MSWRCRIFGHTWTSDTDNYKPHGLQAQTQTCNRCGTRSETVEDWKTCPCSDCSNLRRKSVSELVNVIAHKHGTSYYKTRRDGGVYVFTEDPHEVPLAVDALTHKLEKEAGELDVRLLANVASIRYLVIAVQGACDESAKNTTVDTSTAVQFARQELAKRGELHIVKNNDLLGQQTVKSRELVKVSDWEYTDLPRLPDFAVSQPESDVKPELREQVTHAKVDNHPSCKTAFICPQERSIYTVVPRLDDTADLYHVDIATRNSKHLCKLKDDYLLAEFIGNSLVFGQGDHREQNLIYVSGSELTVVPVMNGVASTVRTTMNGRLVLWGVSEQLAIVGASGLECQLKLPDSAASSAWGHPRKNILLIDHQPIVDRLDPDGVDSWKQPRWYELVRFDERCRLVSSEIILEESEAYQYSKFTFGSDGELLFVDRLQNAALSYDLNSGKLSRATPEGLSVNGEILQANTHGQLLISVENPPELYLYDRKSQQGNTLLTFVTDSFTFRVDKNWHNSVSIDTSTGELFTAELSNGSLCRSAPV